MLDDKGLERSDLRKGTAKRSREMAESSRRRCLTMAALILAAVRTRPASAAGNTASIAATLLDGTPFSTERLKGKVVVVNFWATWCAPCREEMPALDAWYRAHREEGIEVLALSVDELAKEAEVREAAKPFSFPVAMMKTSKLGGFGRIWRMPVSAVIDKQGRLVKQDWFIEPRVFAPPRDDARKPRL
jgi:cytochrome c biogenesis protein CcmG/thiol:disulfide interchange protein DsbE